MAKGKGEKVEVEETVVEPKLNAQQLAFIDAYLGAANFNGTAAARIAKYKGADNVLAVQANRLLRKAKIQAEIKRRLMDKTEIEARLNEHARASLGDLLDDKGKFDLAKARQTGKDRLLKELTVTVDKQVNRISYKYKIHDPQAALDKLAKIQGLYVEKHEHTGAGGGAIEHKHGTIEEWNAEADKKLKEIQQQANSREAE